MCRRRLAVLLLLTVFGCHPSGTVYGVQKLPTRSRATPRESIRTPPSPSTHAKTSTLCVRAPRRPSGTGKARTAMRSIGNSSVSCMVGDTDRTCSTASPRRSARLSHSSTHNLDQPAATQLDGSGRLRADGCRARKRRPSPCSPCPSVPRHRAPCADCPRRPQMFWHKGGRSVRGYLRTMATRTGASGFRPSVGDPAGHRTRRAAEVPALIRPLQPSPGAPVINTGRGPFPPAITQ